MNIFIFHRDFRIEDNRGLMALATEEKEIYLLFILTKEQIKDNIFFNKKSFQAMLFCLQKLCQEVHVNVLSGENEITVIKKILELNKNKVNKIYTNKDFSPYALKRSSELKELAKNTGFIYREFYDYMLFAPQEVKKSDGSFYKIFTAYWNAAQLKNLPAVFPKINFEAKKIHNIETININNYKSNNFNLPLTKEQVELVVTRLPKDYNKLRDDISLIDKGTSQISTAIKYGVVSIRQIHKWAIMRFGYFNNSFSRQLIWRDFFYQSVYNGQIEKKWIFGDNWNEKMNNLVWENDENKFIKWVQGETGVPLVDAGMKQLNNYGVMHNRVRMICASFLVKNLNIDWKKGEKYFATKLIDYDPIVNQCSWQWVAGTGFDAQPYFRILNPYLQQEKYDTNLVYVNHFLKRQTPINPIVDYQESVLAAKKRYKKIVK